MKTEYWCNLDNKKMMRLVPSGYPLISDLYYCDKCKKYAASLYGFEDGDRLTKLLEEHMKNNPRNYMTNEEYSVVIKLVNVDVL